MNDPEHAESATPRTLEETLIMWAVLTAAAIPTVQMGIRPILAYFF